MNTVTTTKYFKPEGHFEPTYKFCTVEKPDGGEFFVHIRSGIEVCRFDTIEEADKYCEENNLEFNNL